MKGSEKHDFVRHTGNRLHCCSPWSRSIGSQDFENERSPNPYLLSLAHQGLRVCRVDRTLVVLAKALRSIARTLLPEGGRLEQVESVSHEG
jgi:hypothetical protein